MTFRPLLLATAIACLSTALISQQAFAAKDLLDPCRQAVDGILSAAKDDKAKPDYKAAISACGKATESLKGKPELAEANRLMAQIVDTRDDSAVDRKTAFRLFKAAANQGDAIALNRLGELYRDGRGVDADMTKALANFEKAAAKGNSDAMVSLADAYFDGSGVEADEPKAVEWYRKAAALNNSYGWQGVGYAYDMGRGVQKDLKQAMDAYLLGAMLGNDTSMNNLAVLYENGEVVPQDYGAARGWYERSIETGKNSMAYFNLAVMYRDGHGVYVDPVKAGQLMAKSLARNEAAARDELKTNAGGWPQAAWVEIQRYLAAERGYKGPLDGSPSPVVQELIAQPVE